ncbi:uncharacterized protein RBU47_016711 [Passerculus sandwichensis]
MLNQGSGPRGPAPRGSRLHLHGAFAGAGPEGAGPDLALLKLRPPPAWGRGLRPLCAPYRGHPATPTAATPTTARRGTCWALMPDPRDPARPPPGPGVPRALPRGPRAALHQRHRGTVTGGVSGVPAGLRGARGVVRAGRGRPPAGAGPGAVHAGAAPGALDRGGGAGRGGGRGPVRREPPGPPGRGARGAPGGPRERRGGPRNRGGGKSRIWGGKSRIWGGKS